jgi:ribonuclease HI
MDDAAVTDAARRVWVRVTEGEASPAVEIYTDGASSGNPRTGRLGSMAQLRHTREGALRRRARPDDGQPHGAHGGHPGTRGTERSAVVRLHTNSAHLRNGITAWLAHWKEDGWRNRYKQPVKNADLWQRLALAARAPPAAMSSGRVASLFW